MKVLILIFTLFYCHSQVSAASGRECKIQDECSNEECCAIPPLFPIMSKRLVKLPMEKNLTGHCMTYLPEGASCNPLSQLNGLDCGCGPELHCKFYPYTSEKFGKRKLMPGRRVCEKKIESQ